MTTFYYTYKLITETKGDTTTFYLIPVIEKQP